jgi:ribosome biogenesis GTPase / thiamine phosphate phosphatase
VPSLQSESHGLVTETQRRNFTVLLDSGESLACIAQGREQSIACGDRVVVDVGNTAIKSVLPRSRLFYRADAFKQKIVAANVTQVLMVLAADPPPSDPLLQRWLVTAEATGVAIKILANKQDLPNQEALNKILRPISVLGYPIVPISTLDTAHLLATLLPHLHGQHSVVIGQSGVGKSSIINALLSNAKLRVGALSLKSQHAGIGTHTTTNSRLLPIDAESWIIDSPGLQVFGVAHLSAHDLIQGFPEFRALAGSCRFRDCSHTHEKDCALKTAVTQGHATAHRLNTLTAFLKENNL